VDSAGAVREFIAVRHRTTVSAAAVAAAMLASVALPAGAETVSRAYTRFDADNCRHTRGKDVEDYGSWLCAGYGGIPVRLAAGDQRMFVSFGRNAAMEPAAGETFPGFNSAYKGTIEWRIATPPGGKPRPFATILRWSVKLEQDERNSSGQVLVVTRLGPGGVCHVGYVDGRANPDANVLAQRLADDKARGFKCGKDKPAVAGNVTPGLNMPEPVSR
jgi:hypothetical protein